MNELSGLGSDYVSLPGIQIQAQSRNEVCSITFSIKKFKKSYLTQVSWPLPSVCGSLPFEGGACMILNVGL